MVEGVEGSGGMTDAALQGGCRWCECVVDPLLQARTIIQEVADEHRVPANDIYGRSQKAYLVAARRCAIRRIREETSLNLVAIGDLLGRDHSTIIYHLNGGGTGARAAATSGGVRR